MKELLQDPELEKTTAPVVLLKESENELPSPIYPRDELSKMDQMAGEFWRGVAARKQRDHITLGPKLN